MIQYNPDHLQNIDILKIMSKCSLFQAQHFDIWSTNLPYAENKLLPSLLGQLPLTSVATVSVLVVLSTSIIQLMITDGTVVGGLLSGADVFTELSLACSAE